MLNGICHWSERLAISVQNSSYASLTVFRVPVTVNLNCPDPVTALRAALTAKNQSPHESTTHYHLVDLMLDNDGQAFAEIEVEFSSGE